MVYCDQQFDGGGWTLILSTNYGQGAGEGFVGEVTPGSSSHMDGAIVRLFANAATQVHVRSANDAANNSITSIPNNVIIRNLRALVVVNEGVDESTAYALWTGPNAIAERLNYGCPTESRPWPSIYWACNNARGLHLIENWSMWVWNTGNVPMEVYVR
jgi:hypothetical protein